MEISGIPATEWVKIVDTVSRERYDGNVILDGTVHGKAGYTLLSGTGTRFRTRVKVADSRDIGARRSWSGRRMPAACWHVLRDVLAVAFLYYPDARVYTGLARRLGRGGNYLGERGFLRNYPRTADINIGSMMQPAYMPELCDCSDEIRYGYGPADALEERVNGGKVRFYGTGVYA